MKKAVLFILSASLFILVSGCAEKTKPLTAPKDFTALLDYKQLPGGKTYGSVIIASNNYGGKVKAVCGAKKGDVNIKPGQIKEIPAAFDLVVGNTITVKGGERIIQIPVKYDSPRAFSLGFVDSPGAMFTKNTPFITTRGKGRYISTIHVATTKKTSYSLPGSGTKWFAVSFKRSTAINDKEGLIVIKNKKIEPRKIYYVTTYYYDEDHNYIGGNPGWEARYMPAKQ